MRRASTRTDRYGHVAIAFHWTIAALVLVNLWIGIAGGSFALHKAIGISVLALTLGGGIAMARFVRRHGDTIGEARFDTRHADDERG